MKEIVLKNALLLPITLEYIIIMSGPHYIQLPKGNDFENTQKSYFALSIVFIIILNMVQITYVPSELTPIFCVIPLVFVFLWTLIVGDFKNFTGSKKSSSVFTAKDPVNCYQNFPQANGKEHSN